MKNISYRPALVMAIVFLLLSSLSFTSSCRRQLLNPDSPLTITMWHNYGGQMKFLMDEMIDEFNATTGAERGIIVNVTTISGSHDLHEMLKSAAEETPGALPLPDITTAYPKTAIILHRHGLLADLKQFFTDEKLESFIDSFVEEGQLGTESLYVFPIAKSTEVLFVNQTLFDRFASENDIDYDDLATFEGIATASMAYLEWTDSKTPDISGDGKAFFMSDSLFNQALVGSRQIGEPLISVEEGEELSQQAALNLDNSVFDRIWNSFFTPAVCGGFAVFDGYSSDLFKTGDLVCSVGSTAGVLFYPDTITFADNTQEQVTYKVLPYPVYEGGRKIALQRGSGLCVISSVDARELAASVFLEWFTSPKQNLRFTLSSGYLPVTKEAFNSLLVSDTSSLQNDTASWVDNPRIAQQLATVLQMYDQYDFFYAVPADNSDELEQQYEHLVMDRIRDARRQIALELDQESVFPAEIADICDAYSEKAKSLLLEHMR